jgi:type IV pilus assembly protein PilA
MRAEPRHQHDSGFSLVELMIALVVLGVLAAIGFPAYQNYVTRARVSEALVFADGARTRVDLPLAQGQTVPKNGEDLLNSGQRQVDMISSIQWFQPDAKSLSGSLGYVLVSMKLPGQGDQPKSALALQRMSDGRWICTGAAKVGKADALEEKYLPASCHGDGSTLAAGGATAATTCPTGQEMVALTSAGKTHDACTPKCAAGQTRDAANPTQCNSPAVANVPVAPVPQAQQAINSVAAAKPAAVASATAPSAKPAAAAAPAGTARRPGAAGEASIQCHVCDPSMPELCEVVTVETTCTAPNNFCFTFIDNHEDGSKTVQRSCGNFARAYREWWQGTSDDDKCRERIDVEQKLDFTCTFACEKDNCNQSGRSLRPDDDALYMDK